MRIGRALVDGQERTFRVADDGTLLVLPAGSPTPDDAVRDPAQLEALAAADGERVDQSAVELLAPLSMFNRDILCTGWNYWDHYEESKGKREGQDPKERPSHPTFFTKGPDTVAGPNDDVVIDPDLSGQWDYEAEMVIVIGRDGRSIPEDKALEHVAGYMIAQDVSVRDHQRRHGGQWLKGKSMDGSLILGPWLTTPDELDGEVTISFELNGEELQRASTAQMAFTVPQLIAELSLGMTLRAGDVLLTGTPSGIGNAREPQIFLKEGDEMVTRIEGLGEIRNRVAVASLTDYQS